MQILIKCLSGKVLTLEHEADDTIMDIKENVRDMEGTPIEQQRLIYNGKQLSNERTLEDYDIEDDCTINLVHRLRGGGKKIKKGTSHKGNSPKKVSAVDETAGETDRRSEECVKKSLTTYLKLSHLGPKRVRGTAKNPSELLGREVKDNEKVCYYWVELNDKVYTETEVIDLAIWRSNYDKIMDMEYGNEIGLLADEAQQLNKMIIDFITKIHTITDVSIKKKVIEEFYKVL